MTVHIILPTWAVHGGAASSGQLEGAELLRPYLHKSVHLAPSGVDDDAFILSFAHETNALILSNDLFRDHGAMRRKTPH